MYIFGVHWPYVEVLRYDLLGLNNLSGILIISPTYSLLQPLSPPTNPHTQLHSNSRSLTDQLVYPICTLV